MSEHCKILHLIKGYYLSKDNYNRKISTIIILVKYILNNIIITNNILKNKTHAPRAIWDFPSTEAQSRLPTITLGL